MKFRFKIQDYQTTAVENTVAVFSGQPSYGPHTYRRDIGKNTQGGVITYEDEFLGYRNHDIELTPLQLLDNIRKVQSTSDIPMSNDLEKPDGMGACSLDIEMETGTGKTYVYIKTMFELNNRQDLRLHQDHVRTQQTVRVEQVHSRSTQYRHP